MLRGITLDSVLPYVGVVALILLGSLFFPQVLSFDYLSQQLQIAAFLGLLATGATVVILLGHIDLSVPWVLTGAAILSTAMVGTGNPILSALAVPAALAFGGLIGAVNAFGVAYLRIPSMVWTLAVNSMLLGLAVLNTGGFNPKGESSALMVAMASGDVFGLPVSFMVWIAVSLILAYFLIKTPFGRYLRSTRAWGTRCCCQQSLRWSAVERRALAGAAGFWAPSAARCS